MKTKLLLSLAVGILLTHNGNTQTLSDDFNSLIVDTNLWNTELAFGSSQVFQESGHLVLVSRGVLEPIGDYYGGVEITGRFKFASSLDHLRIVFRSNLANVSQYKEKTGMIVLFDQGGGVVIGESQGPTLAQTSSYTVPSNTDVDFRIWDNGFTVKVYVNDFNTPLLTGSSSYRTGNRVAFYNREISSTRTELDYLEIKDPNPSLAIETAAIRLRWPTKSNTTYQVQFSTDLQSWSNLTTIIGTGAETNLIEWTESKAKFYRLLQL